MYYKYKIFKILSNIYTSVSEDESSSEYSSDSDNVNIPAKNLSDWFWYRKKKEKKKTHDSGECVFASAEKWFEDNISQKSED